MSVSKYNYTEECNYNPCPGDCDLCGILGDEDYEYYERKYGAVIEEYEEEKNEAYRCKRLVQQVTEGIRQVQG